MRFLVTAILAALLLPASGFAGTVFLLDGRGWGHGVGMSQWGAEGYARHGIGYRAILAHYYPSTTLSIATPRPVRVLLLRGQPSIRVGSAAPFAVVDARGHTLHLPARSYVVDRRYLLRHQHLRQPLRFRPGAQPLQVNLAGYRGEVLVKQRPGGLMAVDELPLDRYLRGVVPSEVPRAWHAAAYEAQAVAARSYTLATLHPGTDFDEEPDQRSQVYGGIRAERPETNLAVGATAGQVLTWHGAVITAYYFSSSGGRTSSVHDAWPRLAQVPYLVSVRDPYDGISPRHVWPTRILTAARIGRVLGIAGVRDARVVRNSSGRATAVRVLTRAGWRQFPAAVAVQRFRLGSNDFDLRAMDLEAPASSAVFGTRVHLRGWVRGLGKARLQELTARGWVTLGHLHPRDDGRFDVPVTATRSTELRLAYNSLAGDAVTLDVAPRVVLRAEGNRLTAHVSPRLPLQVERLTGRRWRPVAKVNGAFSRTLRPGSYRVKVFGGTEFGSPVSRAVGLRSG